MVVKQHQGRQNETDRFESRVILDGSQTLLLAQFFLLLFESRVILDGSQTF